MGPFPNPQYDISPDGQLGSEMIGKTILHYKITEKLCSLKVLFECAAQVLSSPCTSEH